MHRATRLTFGTVGIGLLAAFLVLGLSGATALHAAPASPVRDGGAALTTGHGMPAAPVHPDAPLNTGVFAAITSAPAPYSTIPAWLNFTIGWWNVTGYTISSANAGATVVVTDILSHHVQASNNVTIVSGQASYAIPLNSTWLGCAFSDPTCTNSLIDTYTFDVVTDLNGAGYGGTFATNDNTSGTFTSFITYTPTWALVSPTTTSVQAGNITVSVAYHAQYVTAVNLNIFSGATLVFTGTFIQSSPGISVAKIWYEGTPGTYAVSIQGVMVWGTEYLNSSITVTAAASVGWRDGLPEYHDVGQHHGRNVGDRLLWAQRPRQRNAVPPGGPDRRYPGSPGRGPHDDVGAARQAGPALVGPEDRLGEHLQRLWQVVRLRGRALGARQERARDVLGRGSFP